MLDTYQLNLAGLLLVCGILFASRSSEGQSKAATEKEEVKTRQYARNYQGSQWAFYVVYALVMGADWLQGPFLYSLYRDEHNVSSELIATLFTTGFLSGATSAYFTGSLADQYGRRLTCLVFCGLYSLSCILTTIPSVPLLFVGRALGGVSTSLLFSVFESWMVTDFHNRFLEKKGLNLSHTFGTMSTLNSIVAIVSGVFSEWIVSATGTRKAPFVVSVGLLGVAWLFIYGQWDENYGSAGKKTSAAEKPAESKLWLSITNKQVLTLGLASTMFEGSMYLFVFFWTPALQAAQTTPSPLPYGIIFASFMASTMCSSLFFNHITARGLLSYTQLLTVIMTVANLCFFNLIYPKSEQSTFWLFCIFEACVGMYFPCMGYLKGRVVDDGVRAQVYGVLRIPLNVFVVVSLLLTGDGEAYGTVFSVCATLLFASSGAVWFASRGGQAP